MHEKDKVSWQNTDNFYKLEKKNAQRMMADMGFKNQGFKVAEKQGRFSRLCVLNGGANTSRINFKKCPKTLAFLSRGGGIIKLEECKNTPKNKRRINNI